MSAKQVPNGAIFAANGEDETADLSVGPDGSILIDCSYDGGRGEVSVSLLPERAALLARAVLRAIHGESPTPDGGRSAPDCTCPVCAGTGIGKVEIGVALRGQPPRCVRCSGTGQVNPDHHKKDPP